MCPQVLCLCIVSQPLFLRSPLHCKLNFLGFKRMYNTIGFANVGVEGSKLLHLPASLCAITTPSSFSAVVN